MPQRGSRNGKGASKVTSRRGAGAPRKATSSQVETCDETCDVCCLPIVDDKEDALLCEGTCQKWFHRYCAGVSSTCFRMLSNSSTPFVCWLCSQELHRTVVAQLQAEISALREEVLELNNGMKASPQWSQVVARNAKPTRTRKAISSTERSNSTQSNRTKPPPPAQVLDANAGLQMKTRYRRKSAEKVKIEGKRKIWGTLRSTTTVAVKNAIKSTTDLEVDVKRKYKTTAPGRGDSMRVSRWWFVVSANEELLKQLEGKWSSVKLQTNWGLEPVLCFNDVDESAQAIQVLPNEPAPPDHATSSSHSQSQTLVQDEGDSVNVTACPQQSHENSAPPAPQD